MGSDASKKIKSLLQRVMALRNFFTAVITNQTSVFSDYSTCGSKAMSRSVITREEICTTILLWTQKHFYKNISSKKFWFQMKVRTFRAEYPRFPKVWAWMEVTTACTKVCSSTSILLTSNSNRHSMTCIMEITPSRYSKFSSISLQFLTLIIPWMGG